MTKKILYVGLDVHKCSITIAIAASEENSPVRSYGQIDNRLGILDRVIGKLQSKESELRFVYEAGPCGYQIYRHLAAKGYHCSVVAPSLIPKRSGNRIKTEQGALLRPYEKRALSIQFMVSFGRGYFLSVLVSRKILSNSLSAR